MTFVEDIITNIDLAREGFSGLEDFFAEVDLTALAANPTMSRERALKLAAHPRARLAATAALTLGADAYELVRAGSLWATLSQERPLDSDLLREYVDRRVRYAPAASALVIRLVVERSELITSDLVDPVLADADPVTRVWFATHAPHHAHSVVPGAVREILASPPRSSGHRARARAVELAVTFFDELTPLWADDLVDHWELWSSDEDRGPAVMPDYKWAIAQSAYLHDPVLQRRGLGVNPELLDRHLTHYGRLPVGYQLTWLLAATKNPYVRSEVVHDILRIANYVTDMRGYRGERTANDRWASELRHDQRTAEAIHATALDRLSPSRAARGEITCDPEDVIDATQLDWAVQWALSPTIAGIRARPCATRLPEDRLDANVVARLRMHRDATTPNASPLVDAKVDGVGWRRAQIDHAVSQMREVLCEHETPCADWCLTQRIARSKLSQTQATFRVTLVVARALGPHVDRYRTFFALVPTWTGTLGEALETTIALAG